MYILSIRNDQVTVKYDNAEPQVITSVRDYHEFLCLEAARLGVRPRDLSVFGSSSMEFPQDDTSNPETIALARAVWWENPWRAQKEAPYTQEENDHRISEDISRQGWALLGVRVNEIEAMFTIGNGELALPELLMWGDRRVAPLLNAVCELMRKNERPFREGELIDLGATLPLRATKCVTRGTYDYGVQLIHMPDIFGRYPDEPDKPLVFGSSVGRVEG
jgi:hypothetical protein